MTGNITKSGLAIALSKLRGFIGPKVRVEQYMTDSEIAAEVLWNAAMMGDVGQKVIADLGCGTGILGIGALILGAKKVYFVESDKEALKTAKNNVDVVKSEGLIANGGAVFVLGDISGFNEKTDTVIQNPPFGTKVRHADREFLEKAVNTAKVIWTFHKSETKRFVDAFCRDNNAHITHELKFEFPIKAMHKFHTRRIYRVKVSCFRIEKPRNDFPTAK